MGGAGTGGRPKEIVKGEERTLPFSSWFARENADAVSVAGSECHFLVYGSTGDGLYKKHPFQLEYGHYAGRGQGGSLGALGDLRFCDADLLVRYLVKLAEARLQGDPNDGGPGLISEVQRLYAVKLDALVCSDKGKYTKADSFVDMFKRLTNHDPALWKERTLAEMATKYRTIHGKAAPKNTLQSWTSAADRVYAAATYLAELEKPILKIAEIGKTGGG